MFDKVRRIPNKIKSNNTHFYAIINNRVPFLLHECKKKKKYFTCPLPTLNIFSHHW